MVSGERETRQPRQQTDLSSKGRPLSRKLLPHRNPQHQLALLRAETRSASASASSSETNKHSDDKHDIVNDEDDVSGSVRSQRMEQSNQAHRPVVSPLVLLLIAAIAFI